MHAALMSGSAPEHGMPFSCTQPAGMGGHGVPSGRTHAWSSGPAYAGIALVNAMLRATAAAAHSSWLNFMIYCPSQRSNPGHQLPDVDGPLAQQNSLINRG
jgi:hypothetical protein